jgi:hypothetical protein
MRRKLRITDRKSGTRDRYAGFTISEVVMASALLILVMVPILKALTSAQVSGTIIERRTRSLILAQAKLDEIRSESIYKYSESFDETDSVIDGSYLCNVTDSAVTADLRQITVSVGNDLSGNSVLDADEVEISLATLIARRW